MKRHGAAKVDCLQQRFRNACAPAMPALKTDREHKLSPRLSSTAKRPLPKRWELKAGNTGIGAPPFFLGNRPDEALSFQELGRALLAFGSFPAGDEI